MRTPNEFEVDQLFHAYQRSYDPIYAREYYLRTRKLKGRKKGAADTSGTGRPQAKVQSNAKAKQRRVLAAQIQNLEIKLNKLEDLIKKKMREEASVNRKAKAKKERAQKEANKPKTAAEKAKAARENKKYRDKHKQELKSKSDSTAGGGSSKSKSKTSGSEATVSDLKALATRVRGKIEVAKQKLAAL
jgi:hypothetical protein